MENKTTNTQNKPAITPTQQSVVQNKPAATPNVLNQNSKPVATAAASLNKKPVAPTVGQPAKPSAIKPIAPSLTQSATNKPVGPAQNQFVKPGSAPVQSTSAKPVANSNNNAPAKVVANNSATSNSSNQPKPIGNNMKKDGVVDTKPVVTTTNLPNKVSSPAPVASKSADTKQVAEPKKIESKPLDVKSSEIKKPDVKLESDKKTELKPAESKPVVKADIQTANTATPELNKDKKELDNKADSVIKPEEKPQEENKKEKKKKDKEKKKDKSEDSYKQNNQPKQGFSFLNFVLCLFILVTFAWLSVCSIFLIDVWVTKDINFFGKSIIYSNNDNLAPKIPDGSMCLYSKDTKNIEEGDIVVYFSSNNIYCLGAVEEINNVYYLIIGKDGNLIPVRKDKVEGVYVQRLETLQKFTDFITLKHNAIIFTALPFVMVGVTELILFLYDRKKKKQKLALQESETPETQPETKEVVKITLIESKSKQEELASAQNKVDNKQSKEDNKTSVEDGKSKDDKLEAKTENKAEDANKTENTVANTATPKVETKPQMPATPAQVPKVTNSGSAVAQKIVPVKPVATVNDSKPEVTKTTIIETKTVKTITTPSGSKTMASSVSTTKPVAKPVTSPVKPAAKPVATPTKPAVKPSTSAVKPAVKPASESGINKSSATPSNVTIKLGANSGASTITVKQSSGSKPGAITIQLNSDKPKAPVAGQARPLNPAINPSHTTKPNPVAGNTASAKPAIAATKPAPPKDGQK